MEYPIITMEFHEKESPFSKDVPILLILYIQSYIYTYN